MNEDCLKLTTYLGERDRLLQLRRHVPVVTVIVDTPDGIDRAYEIVSAVTRERGLVTSELVPALAVLAR